MRRVVAWIDLDRRTPRSIFPSTARRRRGVVLALAIATLVLTLLMAAILIQSVVQHRRHARRELQQLQAFWLAESAYRFAVVQLQADPSYEGAPWRVQLDRHGERQSGVADIEVSAVAGTPGQRQLEITASLARRPYLSRHVSQSKCD